MKEIELSSLTPHFPWSDAFGDLGYQMPYPEVLMTSDRAYAFAQQVSGLLMTQGWEPDTSISYRLERTESTHEAYRLTTEIHLEPLDPAWEVIGIPLDRLIGYITTAVAEWVIISDLDARPMRIVPLSPTECMLVSGV